MRSVKIAITLDQDLVARLDQLVEENQFPSRSRAVQEAVREHLQRARRGSLATECAKLDPTEEKVLAEEGWEKDVEQWPEY